MIHGTNCIFHSIIPCPSGLIRHYTHVFWAHQIGHIIKHIYLQVQHNIKYSESFWRGCAAAVFDRIPLTKEILVENILLAKEKFLIMSPFLHDFKEFQPKCSFLRAIFRKQTNLAQNCQFSGVFVKNIPLAKDFGRKIYPWLRNFWQKIHPCLRNLGSKSDPWERHTPSKDRGGT